MTCSLPFAAVTKQSVFYAAHDMLYAQQGHRQLQHGSALFLLQILLSKQYSSLSRTNSVAGVCKYPATRLCAENDVFVVLMPFPPASSSSPGLVLSLLFPPPTSRCISHMDWSCIGALATHFCLNSSGRLNCYLLLGCTARLLLL